MTTEEDWRRPNPGIPINKPPAPQQPGGFVLAA
jgi:hypothetical protein